MPFEQPGVANIRERKAQRDSERYRAQHEENEEPRKGTIEHLIWMARQKLTPEQVDEFRRKSAERMRQMDLEFIERHRCSECGADTINYSHSFRCPWRGSGF